MRIVHWLVTYHGMGGHPVCSLAASYLLHGSRHAFGSAVTCFELYAHVGTRGPALPTLGGMKERFQTGLAALPRVAFARKSARVDISFVSLLGSEEELARVRTETESLELFRAACLEIATTLPLARTRLKGSDDLDWDAFVGQVNQQLDRLPTKPGEFSELVANLKNGSVRRAGDPSPSATPSNRVLRKKPRILAINHDDHHARHIGCLADGRQFFLTTPFVPAMGGDAGCEYVALYLFDKDGCLLEARIDELGTRAGLDEERARDLFARRLKELGEVQYGRIRVQPFEVERFGKTFGLVAKLPDDEGEEWTVEVEPGNYMAFCEPWDSGEYET